MAYKLAKELENVPNRSKDTPTIQQKLGAFLFFMLLVVTHKVHKAHGNTSALLFFKNRKNQPLPHYVSERGCLLFPFFCLVVVV